MNEDRARRFGDQDRVIAFICECGEGECSETILLTRAGYDARAEAGELVVAPRHRSHAGH